MSIRAIKWAMDASKTADLTPVQRCALFVLAYHHNAKSGLCCPSMQTLGDECGISDRAAREAVRALEHVGFVKAKKRADEKGQASNQYVLFGSRKNKSGRNLRSGTGRNHTTARSGGTTVPTKGSITTKGVAGPENVELKIVGGRHA